MIINAPSVPHTGHHFMMYRVFKDYAKTSVAGHRDVIFREDEDILIADHFHDAFMPSWIECLGKYPCVISLRHPARVLASYDSRNTTIATRRLFFAEWEAMMSVADLFKEPFYFHLDAYDVRKREADYLKDRFGLTHEIDWSVSRETGSKHDNHDLALTEELLKDVPNLFVDFYEQTLLQLQVAA